MPPGRSQQLQLSKMRPLGVHRAFGLKTKEADKERAKEKARQKLPEKLNYGGEKEITKAERAL
jgi:hypothetical protein